MTKTTATLPVLAAVMLASACGTGDSGGLPQTPPTKVKKLTDEGLHNIGGVAAGPKGEVFYALAFDEQSRPGVFSAQVDGGEVKPLYVGDPLLYPSDIAVSCDGAELYVSDMGLGAAATSEFEDDIAPEQSGGGIHRIDTESGDRKDLEATGIARAAGLAMHADCKTLAVTGWTDAGVPALFAVPVDGGTASVVAEGAPLVSPTGVHIDDNAVAWVMDHLARGASGAAGTLFAITEGGDVSEVVSGLGMGRHGGVSLTPGGKTAVIPVLDDLTGESSLLTAHTETMDVQVVPTPDIAHPTGVAAAQDAPVMVVAGEYGLHIATFD